ncbi:NAD-dependent epimerase [Marinobacteraceae bacterium S3BR75-40.1]
MSATQTPLAAKAPVLLAGCGKLGSRVGLALAGQHPVWALRRNAGKVPSPLHPIGGDLTRPQTYADDLPEDLDLVIYCVTPSSYDDAGYEAAFVTALDGLLKQLEARAHPPKHVFFVSSTGVYHQDDDSWVDERSPTEPERFSGQRLLEAEMRLAASPIPSTVVRFSGIYGGDRTGFLDKVLSGGLGPEPAGGFTNRIHEDDCVGVLTHLVDRRVHGHPLADCYLASDSAPIRKGDLVGWIREQIECAPLEPTTAVARSRGAGSKRCNNTRLLESGYRFRFPTYREGYGLMLERLKRQRSGVGRRTPDKKLADGDREP